MLALDDSRCASKGAGATGGRDAPCEVVTAKGGCLRANCTASLRAKVSAFGQIVESLQKKIRPNIVTPDSIITIGGGTFLAFGHGLREQPELL